MSVRSPFLLLPVFLFGLVVLPAHGQESSSVDAERDWLEYYYEKPTPGEFVDRMREYSEDGTLSNENARPALVGFLSQLIRQNRGKLDEWFQQLRGLPPEQMQVFLTAMLYSRTGEADAILEREFGDQFKQQKEELPKILELQLDKTQTIDMLWGFYYATGSENAIRRVISCFNFVDAPKNPDFAKVPEGFDPLYSSLPEAAAWTLVSNAVRHPKVRKYCEEIYKDEDALSPTERKVLRASVLSQLDPAKYAGEG